eukprot:6195170-Pleurochrysis_carterae.AAC.1
MQSQWPWKLLWASDSSDAGTNNAGQNDPNSHRELRTPSVRVQDAEPAASRWGVCLPCVRARASECARACLRARVDLRVQACGERARGRARALARMRVRVCACARAWTSSASSERRAVPSASSRCFRASIRTPTIRRVYTCNEPHGTRMRSTRGMQSTRPPEKRAQRKEHGAESAAQRTRRRVYGAWMYSLVRAVRGAHRILGSEPPSGWTATPQQTLDTMSFFTQLQGMHVLCAACAVEPARR